METGVRHHAIEAENFTDNRHPHVQARIGAQGGKHDTKEIVWEMNHKRKWQHPESVSTKQKEESGNPK